MQLSFGLCSLQCITFIIGNETESIINHITNVRISHVCLFSQGGELARRSVLQDGDSYLTHFYDDARTMYEFFLRGKRVSSKSNVVTDICVINTLWVKFVVDSYPQTIFMSFILQIMAPSWALGNQNSLMNGCPTDRYAISSSFHISPQGLTPYITYNSIVCSKY